MDNKSKTVEELWQEIDLIRVEEIGILKRRIKNLENTIEDCIKELNEYEQAYWEVPDNDVIVNTVLGYLKKVLKK